MRLDLDAFRASLAAAQPPAGLSAALDALWHEAQHGWAHAHDIVQEHEDAQCAWVHAYLHRKEGDLSNAAYWYRRAGKPAATGPLEDEWNAIATALLSP
jgi:hypothetical protein